MTRVLFLCIGNSCRSQMAEGFANRYGKDVMTVASAGLAPAGIVQPLTRKVMEEKNINIDHQQPKNVVDLDLSSFDLIVNMSGRQFPTRSGLEVRDWKIDDPIGKEEAIYIAVREAIEMRVMQLVLELRRKKHPPQPPKRTRRTVLSPDAPVPSGD